jgi:hypothetical protein
MRKTIATVVILGFVWIGYVAWPIYDLLCWYAPWRPAMSTL